MDGLEKLLLYQIKMNNAYILVLRHSALLCTLPRLPAAEGVGAASKLTPTLYKSFRLPSVPVLPPEGQDKTRCEYYNGYDLR